jgi:hypothetical protein
VVRILATTAVDIGKRGYDECFGHGRIDAKRAVSNLTNRLYDAKAPFCPEYKEQVTGANPERNLSRGRCVPLVCPGSGIVMQLAASSWCGLRRSS